MEWIRPPLLPASWPRWDVWMMLDRTLECAWSLGLRVLGKRNQSGCITAGRFSGSEAASLSPARACSTPQTRCLKALVLHGT